MKKLLGQTIVLLALTISISTWAGLFDKVLTNPESPGTAVEFLPADQAFIPSFELNGTNTIDISWYIAEGYYLYADRFKIQAARSDTVLGPVTMLSTPIVEHDSQVGDYPVFHTKATFRTTITQHDNKHAWLKLNYQGCSEKGYCYPPITKTYLVSLTDGLGEEITTNAVATASEQATASTNIDNVQSELEAVNSLFVKHSFGYQLAAFFGFGMLLTFTPCVLPMVPILSGIIVGTNGNTTKRRALLLSSNYVLGMAITYAIAGVIAGYAGTTLQSSLQQPWILTLFSILFALLALSLFGFYELRLPHFIADKLNNMTHKQEGGTYLGVILMGAISALVVSPCVTPPLIGALAYISQTENGLLGGNLLFAMGLGMGTPLIIGATLGGHLLPKAGPWMESVKAIFGVFMLGLAIWILDRVIPNNISLILWSLLIIGSGIYAGALEPCPNKSWQRLWKAVGVILLLYGGILFVAAFIGGGSLLQPFPQHITSRQQIVTEAKPKVRTIKTIAELNKVLSVGASKPSMLEFTAQWCISCEILDRTVFAKQDVQQALTQVQVLKADVSANDADDKALQSALGVYAPPTFVFFDNNGQELTRYRLVGEFSKEKFLSIINAVLTNKI